MKYECAICGQKDVKLWRPHGRFEPLICAKCAEVHQVPRKAEERIWKLTFDGYLGIPTGNLVELPKWEINEKGQIPIRSVLTPENIPMQMTDQLAVNLVGICDSHTTGVTCMIPAVPDEEGGFYHYTHVPDELITWWKNLPNKK